MPSSATITTFHTFVQDTRARASQANTNFSNFRGHLISIEPLTATSSDNAYDLGSDEHRWRALYTNSVDLETSTSTASLSYVGDVSSTLGAHLFKIEGTEYGRIGASTTSWDQASTTGQHLFKIKTVTKAVVDNNGLDGAYLKALSVDTAQLANASVTPGKRSAPLYNYATITSPVSTSQNAACAFVGTGRPVFIFVATYGGATTFTADSGTRTLQIYKGGSALVSVFPCGTGGDRFYGTMYLDPAGNVGSVTYDVRSDAGTITISGAGAVCALYVFEI